MPLTALGRPSLGTDKIVPVIGVFITIYHLLFVFTTVTFTGVLHRNAHLLLVFSYVLLSTITIDSDDDWKRYLWYGYTAVLLFAAIGSTAYVYIQFDTLVKLVGLIRAPDVVIGSILIFLAIETTRRRYGWPLPIMAILSLIYGLFGNYFPGVLNHSGIAFDFLVYQLTLGFVGIYGFIIGLSAGIVAVFMIFGGVFKELGAAEFFEEFAKSIAGRFRSGPAQVAVISSGLVGSLTGAAVANVAATGSYSIPLMKRLGYDKNYAGAIESSASTGGQIMPPVMGAAAFIMASLLDGYSYLDIVIAATIPALIFYLTVMFACEFRARSEGLTPLSDDERKPFFEVIPRGYTFIPILVVIFILFSGKSPIYSAGVGVLSVMAIFGIEAGHRILSAEESSIELKENAGQLVHGLAEGGRMVAEVGVALSLIAIIVRIMGITGLTQQLGFYLSELSGGILIVMLLLTAGLSILLGFSVTTSAAYLIVAIVTAPALIEFGIHPLAAHMYVFYFAVLSAISPPVATAALVASKIADGEFIRTALLSMKLSLAAYLLPLMWIVYPELLFIDGQSSTILFVFNIGKIGLAMIVFASLLEGHLVNRYTNFARVLTVVFVGLIIYPNALISLVGLGGVLFMVIGQYYEFSPLSVDIEPTAE